MVKALDKKAQETVRSTQVSWLTNKTQMLSRYACPGFFFLSVFQKKKGCYVVKMAAFRFTLLSIVVFAVVVCMQKLNVALNKWSIAPTGSALVYEFICH